LMKHADRSVFHRKFHTVSALESEHFRLSYS
jgi:hypothetical protein